MAYCIDAQPSVAIFIWGLCLTSRDALDLEVKTAVQLLDTHTCFYKQSSSLQQNCESGSQNTHNKWDVASWFS